MLTLHVSNFAGLPILIFLANVAIASIVISAATLLTLAVAGRSTLPLRHALLVCGLLAIVGSPVAVALIQRANCSLIGLSTGPAAPQVAEQSLNAAQVAESPELNAQRDLAANRDDHTAAESEDGAQ